MIRMVLAVLLLLTAACSADPAPPGPTQAASSPPSGPGRFTGVLDACSLLTVEQVEQLVTLAEQRYTGAGCTWSTAGSGLEGRAIYELEVGVHLAADVVAAHSFFTKPPDYAFPAMAGKELPEPHTSANVGEESFVLTPTLSETTILTFRLSNAVININYGWRASPGPQHQERAVKAAQWIAEAIDRPAPTADPLDGRFAAAPYACSLLPEGVPQSATQCGGLKVRRARAWKDKSGITVAKEIMAYYKGRPFQRIHPLKGLGDEAFSDNQQYQVTVWVRVSNLVLKIPFNQTDGKVTPEIRAEAAEILSRLPAH
ncbi:hypothetical protein ACIHFD_36270 [Nonomuraea sp. NPDC051941]|uniref:hypothetical protein n=1 Tax=Nonomuraea sp. NPDC051941 TaxID=3364373 RepID=UPI0037CA5250